MAIEHDELARVVAGKSEGVSEDVVERALRPRRLDEYIGQRKIRDMSAEMSSLGTSSASSLNR